MWLNYNNTHHRQRASCKVEQARPRVRWLGYPNHVNNACSSPLPLPAAVLPRPSTIAERQYNTQRSKLVHQGINPDKETGAILTPIVQSTTFIQDSVEKYLVSGACFARRRQDGILCVVCRRTRWCWKSRALCARDPERKGRIRPCDTCFFCMHTD